MLNKININRLKVVLVEQSLSHKQFAFLMKKAPNTITRICNNQQQPSLILLREMAVALNVNVCDLLMPIPLKATK
jgi:putative transcriptional regulator